MLARGAASPGERASYSSARPRAAARPPAAARAAAHAGRCPGGKLLWPRFYPLQRNTPAVMVFVFLGTYTSGSENGGAGPEGHSNYMERWQPPSRSRGIYRAEFDSETGMPLSDPELAVAVPISPSWMQWHPSGRLPVLYSVNSTFDGTPRYPPLPRGCSGTRRCRS